ncbi:MAG: GNAT family N-acetyltransferase [Deltaproteobacteria bacterium]|nr:GNAT family N-acetyltransferase [Deltaproteobacteria bacterium]
MKDEMHRWKVREGDEKDLKGVLSLRRTVFGEMEKDKLDPRFWQWEFMGGPDRKALIYVVEDGDKIIGHFADLPRQFSVHRKVVRGTLSVDLMVSPDYRRKGIFEEMGRYAIRRVKEEGNSLMTAYPIRKETISGFKKIGWKEVVPLPVLVYPIRFSGIANRYLHFLPLSLLIGGLARILYNLLFAMGRKKESGRIEIEKVGELDSQFEHFWDKAISLYPIMGIRSRSYMTWRYLHHPTRTYIIYRAMEKGEMRGYIILRKVDLLGFNSAVIVDLLAIDADALTALGKKGIAYSQKEGVDLLGFMVPETHPYYRLLRKHGFLRSPKTFRFMLYPHEQDKELLNPKRWHINWGDTDVI